MKAKKAKLDDLLYSISINFDVTSNTFRPNFQTRLLLSKLVSNKGLSLWMLSNELTSELNNDN